jgi:hypothetical protein
MGVELKMQTSQAEPAIPEEGEMVSEEETLEGALPFEDYAKDSEHLKEQIAKLEKQYDQREKLIERILDYGTGIESEKALRMYTTPVLEKWAESLEANRLEKLKQK